MAEYRTNRLTIEYTRSNAQFEITSLYYTGANFTITPNSSSTTYWMDTTGTPSIYDGGWIIPLNDISTSGLKGTGCFIPNKTIVTDLMFDKMPIPFWVYSNGQIPYINIILPTPIFVSNDLSTYMLARGITVSVPVNTSSIKVTYSTIDPIEDVGAVDVCYSRSYTTAILSNVNVTPNNSTWRKLFVNINPTSTNAAMKQQTIEGTPSTYTLSVDYTNTDVPILS